METLLCIQQGFDCSQLLTPAIALIGIILALIQIEKNNKTRRADFAHRLDVEFFTDETRNCFEIIEFIEFIEPKTKEELPFFKIDKTKIDKLSKGYFSIKEFCDKRGYEISSSELDDYLLGQFEKIGLYRKKKVIAMAYIYELFDYYISGSHNNSEIQKYIQWVRKFEDTKDIYDKFDFVAKECDNYRDKKYKK